MSGSKKIHFTGIGGSGMSALSQIAAMEGRRVSGSDRDFDNSRNLGFKASLEKLGIKIFPQDGSGIDGDTEEVAVSTAIEDSNPEIARARALGARLTHRSELLASYVDNFKTIAVGGTSGKSTVVGMVFTILEEAGLSPSVITGGPLVALKERGLIGNAWRGKGEILVIEADESDGTIEKYRPAAGLILNISKDHKDVAELKRIFAQFAKNAKKLYLNADDPELAGFRDGAELFGIEDSRLKIEDLRLEMFGSGFKMNGLDFRVPAPGAYNIQNALAAVKVCLDMGVPLEICAAGLAKYKGVQRRFELVGEAGGALVVDDYAHNPAKVAAVLGALHGAGGGRIIAIYQPHGFTPARHLKKELIAAFAANLKEEDILFMPEIYYVGGTVAKDISSKDFVDELSRLGRKAFYFERRPDIISEAAGLARPGDIFLVMGARDWTLSDFARDLFERIKKR
ncbi:MAG: hypothetical protein HY796_02620 [Elusimicrobia bacterium]|nr:hypothetical protein [Elusimicrobiota bacterium]